MRNDPEPRNDPRSDPRARRLRRALEEAAAEPGPGRPPFGPQGRLDPSPALRFGGGRIAVAGVLAGLGIALGGPAVLLSLGQSLGQVVLTILVVLSMAGGALICLVSAFFGLVIPRHMAHGPWMDPDKWRRFAWAMERRHELHRRRYYGRGRAGWDGDDDGDDEDLERKGRR